MSTPTGAAIYLDGINTGNITPNTLSGINTGSHNIKCVKTGYNDQTQTISVSADQTTNVQMTLTPVEQMGYVLAPLTLLEQRSTWTVLKQLRYPEKFRGCGGQS